jgi:hypothetical protein
MTQDLRIVATAFRAPLVLVTAALACSTSPDTAPPESGGAAGTGGTGLVSAGGTSAGGAGAAAATGGVGGAGGKGGTAASGGTGGTGGAATAGRGGGGSGGSGAGTAGAGAGGAAMGGGGGNGGAGAMSAGGMAGAGGGQAGGSSGTSAGGPSAGSGGSGGGATTGRSKGCGQTSTVTFGSVPGESGQAMGTGKGGYVQINGRGFAMRLPDNYDNNKPYWLVFGFHWNGGNSKEVDTGGSNGYNMAHFGLQKLSNNGAIFVAPDGRNGGWGNSNGEDLDFVDAMVTLIQDNYCVDTKHIFANGFSYGGGMSYALACARADVFRGVAIYNGAVLSGCEGGNQPIAYWQMAGQTDNVCTIGAGRMMRDRFVQNNGCTAQNPPEPPQPPPFIRPGGHVCTTYTGCDTGFPLRWCAHQSGHGNAVVDGSDSLYNTCANPGNTCSDSCPCTWVPDDVWTFFKSL